MIKIIKLVGDRTDAELDWFIEDCKKCIKACDKYDDEVSAHYHDKRLKEAEAEKEKRSRVYKCLSCNGKVVFWEGLYSCGKCGRSYMIDGKGMIRYMG